MNVFPAWLFKGLFFPIKLSWHFCWKSIIYVWDFLPELWILFHCSLCLCLCQYRTVMITLLCSKFWSGSMSSSTLLLFFKISLGVLHPLYFCISFRVSLSSICPKGTWNFNRDYAEFVDQFGEYYHLNNSKSSIQWSWNMSLLS